MFASNRCAILAQECGSCALKWARSGLSNRHSSAVHFCGGAGGM